MLERELISSEAYTLISANFHRIFRLCDVRFMHI